MGCWPRETPCLRRTEKTLRVHPQNGRFFALGLKLAFRAKAVIYTPKNTEQDTVGDCGRGGVPIVVRRPPPPWPDGGNAPDGGQTIASDVDVRGRMPFHRLSSFVRRKNGRKLITFPVTSDEFGPGARDMFQDGRPGGDCNGSPRLLRTAAGSDVSVKAEKIGTGGSALW